jgi:hypothetical protein
MKLFQQSLPVLALAKTLVTVKQDAQKLVFTEFAIDLTHGEAETVYAG